MTNRVIDENTVFRLEYSETLTSLRTGINLFYTVFNIFFVIHITLVTVAAGIFSQSSGSADELFRFFVMLLFFALVGAVCAKTTTSFIERFREYIAMLFSHGARIERDTQSALFEKLEGVFLNESGLNGMDLSRKLFRWIQLFWVLFVVVAMVGMGVTVG